MRSKTSSLVIVFSIAAFAACSGETTENPGGGGGSGGGGTTSTTTSSTTTTTTGSATSSTTAASTTAASSGSGGGAGLTECEEACAKVEECSDLSCESLSINCSEPGYECASQCILDTACEDLNITNTDLLVCFSDCDAGAGGGNADAAACRSCAIANSCLTLCALSDTCQSWLECAQGCFQNDPQPTCFDACDTKFPGAERQFDAVYSCACTNCDESCDTVAAPCN
ncbi:hypothetical protein [Sorangium sp. So ce693]|uniref:hypothetical protein n=1 Tax=Sorangium sp. So ce693 TaxID=3133318 RepID=UPI003F62B682